MAAWDARFLLLAWIGWLRVVRAGDLFLLDEAVTVLVVPRELLRHARIDGGFGLRDFPVTVGVERFEGRALPLRLCRLLSRSRRGSLCNSACKRECCGDACRDEESGCFHDVSLSLNGITTRRGKSCATTNCGKCSGSRPLGFVAAER